MGGDEGAQDLGRVLNQQKSHASTWEICKCASACEPRVSCVCACTSDLLPLSAEEEEGAWLSGVVFYVSAVCRCCRRQRLVCASLCNCLSVSSLRPSVCVSLGHMRSITTG